MNPTNARAHAQARMAASAPPDPYVLRQYYTYSIIQEAIAAGATADGSVSIQAHANFQIDQFTATVLDANGAVITGGAVQVQLTDTGSGSNLFDAALPIPAIFGTAAQPFILPIPKILAANTTLSASITNNTAGAVDVFLVFPGVRLFPRG